MRGEQVTHGSKDRVDIAHTIHQPLIRSSEREKRRAKGEASRRRLT